MQMAYKTWFISKDTLLSCFETLVKEGIYNKIPYYDWRKLKTYEGEYFGIIWDKTGTVKITAVIDNGFHQYDTAETIYLGHENANDQLIDFILSGYQLKDNTHFLGGAVEQTPQLIINDNNANVNTLYEKVNTLYNKIENKEKKDMRVNNDFMKFDFGPVSNNQFRMSPYGIAVATSSNGWVAYNVKTNEVFDVDILNFNVSKLIYKMPVAFSAIAVGDILIHSGKPVFVRAINSNGTVSVLNYADSTVVDILPIKNAFGFNFFTKVVSLIDFNNISANKDNPFGNMLPFLMMSDDFDPMMLLLMNNSTMVSNPMMMYFLMNKNNDDNNLLPMMLMMNSNNFNLTSNAAPTE